MLVFLIGMPEIHSILKDISKIPGITVENNFQQVLGMVKSNELKRLCIYMDAWNCDENYNGLRGQPCAEKIHAIAPEIPVLIWDGREYISDEDIAPVFKVTGELKPIINDNELYLSFDHYKSSMVIEITRQFFKGTLTIKDVQHRECLNITRKDF